MTTHPIAHSSARAAILSLLLALCPLLHAGQYTDADGRIVTARPDRPTRIVTADGTSVHVKANATDDDFALFGYTPYTPPAPPVVEPTIPEISADVRVAAGKMLGVIARIDIQSPADFDDAIAKIRDKASKKPNTEERLVLAEHTIELLARRLELLIAGGTWDDVVRVAAETAAPSPEQ